MGKSIPREKKSQIERELVTAKPNQSKDTLAMQDGHALRVSAPDMVNTPSLCLLLPGERESVFIIFIYLLVGWLAGPVKGKLADGLGVRAAFIAARV